ncbi:hypothetical protein ACGRHY_14585 [Streptomyces sp. HK10]|uniref:helix-turn-helix domain-containing protein n=1 Tax=Streptomyces sp. HK10 TaxID=3373255 RepID=UPI0037488655
MTQSPRESVWSERLASAIAHEVRRHRMTLGLSAQQLSDRCAELGMPIQRSVLANLESGRRATVTVAEVLVLAAALGIAPAQLLFAVGYEEKVEPLPGCTKDPLVAVEWLAGDKGLNRQGFGTMNNPIAAFKWHQRNVDLLRNARINRDKARSEYVDLKDQMDDLKYRLVELRARMEPLEQEVTDHRESLRDVSLAERPELPEHIAQARSTLKELRAEERVTAQAVDSIRWVKESIGRWEGQISHIGGRLVNHRRKMRERGWMPPPLDDDVAEFVIDAPWQDMFDIPLDDEDDSGQLPLT